METNIETTNNSFVLLKAMDIADRLNISRSLAYQLMQTGDIPTVRMNRTIRVRESDLEAYIQKCWSGWKEV